MTDLLIDSFLSAYFERALRSCQQPPQIWLFFSQLPAVLRFDSSMKDSTIFVLLESYFNLSPAFLLRH